MVDHINPAPSGPQTQNAHSDQGVIDQARAAGRDLKDKAAEIAGSTSDVVKLRASEFVSAAKDVASDASGKIVQAAEDKKSAGADYVGGFADTLRRAAKEFDAEMPIAGVYIRKAAAKVEDVSDSIKTGNFNDLVRNTQAFAREQPTAFLGLAVLAGFGAVRFLKSSAKVDDQASASTIPAGASEASR